ncbi:hypothetical protein [Chitinivibrio alkaliphilus]|uniref:Uncharacterized protein n=1 Tax=Chitinivibrio alkaliphilus ACht1 TaxID=1313304 RepID=U7D6E2_9BACT|nr:hypothetical protein [Chitinivibrio alkaliphilus]ERP32084.1 hypothetical protein CALK_1071 [Chitinivibrio alkaliphilus ACht1]
MLIANLQHIDGKTPSSFGDSGAPVEAGLFKHTLHEAEQSLSDTTQNKLKGLAPLHEEEVDALFPLELLDSQGDKIEISREDLAIIEDILTAFEDAFLIPLIPEETTFEELFLLHESPQELFSALEEQLSTMAALLHTLTPETEEVLLSDLPKKILEETGMDVEDLLLRAKNTDTPSLFHFEPREESLGITVDAEQIDSLAQKLNNLMEQSALSGDTSTMPEEKDTSTIMDLFTHVTKAGAEIQELILPAEKKSFSWL